MPQTILTGVKANGDLHLGHYFGVIDNTIQAQNRLNQEDKFFLFVPDLHSFTTPIDFSKLYDNTIENFRIYLAAGLNPNRPNSYVYRQSHVPAHSELAWILSCFTYFGEASRMIQFKEKSTQHGQNVTVGLMTYPILMAADILLYEGQYIPLGDDQRQHLEIARDVAIRINNKFAESFPDGVFKVLPEPWAKQLEFFGQEEGIRIRSLSNPETKMSKSVSDPKGTILLIDSPKDAAKKVMSATTDSFELIQWDWKTRPGITNLLQLYALLSHISMTEARQTWEGQSQYGDLKKTVAGLVEAFLSDFQSKLSKVSASDVDSILDLGEKKANVIANETLYRVQQAVGLKK